MNPILHTVWLDSHKLTLKNYTARYFGEKPVFCPVFSLFFPESMKIKVKFIKFFTFSAESVEKIILMANQPLPVMNIKCT